MSKPAKRRRFNRQFKVEAVQLVVERDRPIAEVARELQLNETTLGNWVKAWRRELPRTRTRAVSCGACPRG